MVRQAGALGSLEQSLEHALCFPEERRRRELIALELCRLLEPEAVIQPLLEWLENLEKRPETPTLWAISPG